MVAKLLAIYFFSFAFLNSWLTSVLAKENQIVLDFVMVDNS